MERKLHKTLEEDSKQTEFSCTEETVVALCSNTILKTDSGYSVKLSNRIRQSTASLLEIFGSVG